MRSRAELPLSTTRPSQEDARRPRLPKSSNFSLREQLGPDMDLAPYVPDNPVLFDRLSGLEMLEYAGLLRP